MKKTITIIVLLLACTLYANAQLTIRYSFGYASYDRMDDMKDLLKTMEMTPEMQMIQMKIVSNFPGYFTHSLDFTQRYRQHEYGFRTTYLTTGGKLSRADYSGEVSLKITLNGFRQGILYRNYFYNNQLKGRGNLSLYGEISPALMVSQIKIDTDVRINDQEQSERLLKASKLGFAILPQFGINYNPISNINLNASIGYEITSDATPNALTGNQAINWTGFRASVGVAYTINFNN